MHYEGTIEAPVSRDRFYSFVTDPAKVVTIFPDVLESSIADPDHFSVKAKAGVGSLKGNFAFSFEIVERTQNGIARLVGHGQGMQSSIEIRLEIALEETKDGTRARWVAEASMGGLLANLGGRLIDGAVVKYVRQITENLRQKVAV